MAIWPNGKIVDSLSTRLDRRGTIIEMRKLSYDFKLPGRSLAEVYERFHGALNRHRAVGRIKFNGRKLSAEAMVNAVILSFLDLDEGQQEAILSTYVPRFEAMLTEGPPSRHDGRD